MATYLKGGFVVTVMLQLLTICTAQYKLVCLYTSTSSDRLNLDKIDPHLCTHIIYGSFGITLFDIQSFEENIRKFIDLKKENPKLKILAELNGINLQQFSEISGDPDKRLIVRASVKNFTVSHGFDGITLNTGVLVPRIATSAEKENFVELLRDLREEFHEPELLLTATFWAHENLPRENYNIGEIMKHLDFANLMILNQQNLNFTTHFAPLYSSSPENHSSPKQQSVNDSISYWLDEGAPSEKLLVGLPFFGQTFELSDKSVNGMMAPTTGPPGNPGPHLQLAGMLSYNDICENLKTENWTLGWDNEQKVPFAYNGNRWVGYEDLRSIQLKTQYVKNHRLGGMMLWSFDLDNFLGTCGEKNALSRMVNENLRAIDPECEPFIDVAQPRPLCDQPNLGPDDDCKVFYVCDKGKKYTFRIL